MEMFAGGQSSVPADPLGQVSWENYGRRGRVTDLGWPHRLMLLRAVDTPSPRDLARLRLVLADDPSEQLGAMWEVKEQLRALSATTTTAEARAAPVVFDVAVAGAWSSAVIIST